MGISSNPYGFVADTSGATSGTGGISAAQGGGLAGSTTSGVPQAAGEAAQAAGVGNAPQASFLDKALDFVVNNPGKALQYGLLAKNALTLPEALSRANTAAGTLQGNANAGANFGNTGLSNGGALSAAQMQALQDQYTQQLQQGTASILQNAVNAGQDPNSSIVQQRVQALQQQLTTQLEQAQLQIQQSNVSQALAALGVSNQAAGQVAGQQYAQNTGAQATLNQTGQLISQLNALGG
ncbi:hypothetical protein AB4Y36_01500 [Paraburkholderia sp. BR10936]|uniref:hypothetical protein n=1 Tax=Paraburkholderia sp. BR10936 TaxID=3236993 RepID=UPI0034D228AB